MIGPFVLFIPINVSAEGGKHRLTALLNRAIILNKRVNIFLIFGNIVPILKILRNSGVEVLFAVSSFILTEITGSESILYNVYIGIDIKVANELLEKRANLYRAINPETTVICGDITKDDVFSKIISSG